MAIPIWHYFVSALCCGLDAAASKRRPNRLCEPVALRSVKLEAIWKNRARARRSPGLTMSQKSPGLSYHHRVHSCPNCLRNSPLLYSLYRTRTCVEITKTTYKPLRPVSGCCRPLLADQLTDVRDFTASSFKFLSALCLAAFPRNCPGVTSSKEPVFVAWSQRPRVKSVSVTLQ